MAARYYQDDLAYIHHVGFSGLAVQAAPWVVSALRERGRSAGTVVELGCGTGLLLAALSAAGYQTVGIDASAPMLAIASSTAPSARLLHAGLYEAEIPPCAAIIAMGEPLNYMNTPDDEPPTLDLFRRAAAALAPGGTLLFDVVTAPSAAAAAYRTWSAGDDWACLVDVAPHSNGRALRRSITTFRLHGPAYRRATEDHWVHLFLAGHLRDQLRRSGFIVTTSSAYGQVALGPGRLLFDCVRACA